MDEDQQWIASLSLDELERRFPGLREKIEEGLEDCRAGRLFDGEEFFDELDREDAARERGG